MDSGESLPDELGPEGMRAAIDHLAEMGVFHIALGGGESFGLPWLFSVAGHIRRKGMVPNITTNGSVMNEEIARECNLFGQINVSLDGLKDLFEASKGRDGFEETDRALDILSKAHPRVGINVTLNRHNFEHLEAIVRYAKKKRLKEVELLRFKPAGRGREIYFDWRMTPEQNRELYALLGRLTRRYRIQLKLDCSFVPMLCYHRPEKRLLEKLGVFGCEGGNILASVRPDGSVSGCSFDRSRECQAQGLSHHWNKNGSFAVYREWADRAPDPCASCEYLHICKGGCHVVSEFLTGDPRSPDPECPILADRLCH